MSQASPGPGCSRHGRLCPAEEGDGDAHESQGGGHAQGPPQMDRVPGLQHDAAPGRGRESGAEGGGRGQREVAQLHPGQ